MKEYRRDINKLFARLNERLVTGQELNKPGWERMKRVTLGTSARPRFSLGEYDKAYYQVNSIVGNRRVAKNAGEVILTSDKLREQGVAAVRIGDHEVTVTMRVDQFERINVNADSGWTVIFWTDNLGQFRYANFFNSGVGG